MDEPTQGPPEVVTIFETILRDGQQAQNPMSIEVELAIAHLLDELRVDIIEAGFPGSSPGDAEGIKKIVDEVRRPIICVLARAKLEDVESALVALEKAERPRVHIFVPGSDIRLQSTMRAGGASKALDLACQAISYARKHCNDVEFSVEDAARADKNLLSRFYSAAVAEGATTLNIPDTVGHIQPHKFYDLVAFLIHTVYPGSDIVWSVHCHNDLGNAVANSLAGIRAGARQIEGCFLGIGERAGNVALEQVIANLFYADGEYNIAINIAMQKLVPTVRKIAKLIDYPIEPHRAVVGERILKHGAGIHQHGVVQDPRNYEILKAEDIGWDFGTHIVLQSHSGTAGIAARLQELGYRDYGALAASIFAEFKKLADLKGGMLSDEDLHMLVQEHYIRNRAEKENLFSMNDDEDIHYGRQIGGVHIRRNGVTRIGTGFGDGAIDALCKAIRNALLQHGFDLTGTKLVKWNTSKGYGDTEANAICEVGIRKGSHLGYGRASHPDTVIAAAKAYLYACNHLLFFPATFYNGTEG